MVRADSERLRNHTPNVYENLGIDELQVSGVSRMQLWCVLRLAGCTVSDWTGGSGGRGEVP